MAKEIDFPTNREEFVRPAGPPISKPRVILPGMFGAPRSLEGFRQLRHPDLAPSAPFSAKARRRA